MKLLTKLLALLIFFYSPFSAAGFLPLMLTGNAEGTQWSIQNPDQFPPFLKPIQVVQQSNHLLMAGEMYAANTYVMKSTDSGFTWHDSLTSSITVPVGIAANDNGVIMLGKPFVYFSPKGEDKTWYPYSISMGIAQPDCPFVEKFKATAANNTSFLIGGTCKDDNKDTKRSRAFLIKNDNVADNFSWQAIPTLPAVVKENGSTIEKIQWDGYQWTVLMTNAQNQPLFLTSTDTAQWSTLPVPAEIKAIKSWVMDDKTWLAIALYDDKTALIRSTDAGKTWTQVNLPFTQIALNNINYHAQQWVAVGQFQTGTKTYLPAILTSKDGLAWTQVPLPIRAMAASSVSALNDVTWNGSGWVAVGTFDDNLTGCKAFAEKAWAGQLQAINVSYFAITPSTRSKDGKTYEAYGNIAYTADGGDIDISGFQGQCVLQENGFMNINLSVDVKDYGHLTIDAAMQNANDKQILITSSHLPDGSVFCKNFHGPLFVK